MGKLNYIVRGNLLLKVNKVLTKGKRPRVICEGVQGVIILNTTDTRYSCKPLRW